MSNISERCQPFVVGGVAAMSASCVIHPLDLVKVRLQLHTTLNPGTPRPPFISILAKMIKTEGPLSIYAGLSAALLRQSIYGTTRLGLFRTISNELKSRNDGQPLSFTKKVFCGMMSGSIAVAVGTPCDVALVRMQSDTMSPKEIRRGYKNVFDALFRIVKEEGFFKLYSGLLPNIMRGMAVNVGMMAFFDQTKEFIQYVRKEDTNKETSQSTLMVSAAVAGFTNCSLNLPMDNIKSRLQHGSHYRGVWHVVQTIVQKEGILAFWTGFAAQYSRSAPHAMIILNLMDGLNRQYNSFFGTQGH